MDGSVMMRVSIVLFLFGRLVPAAGKSRLALVQGVLQIAGSVAFSGGLAVMLLAGPAWQILPALGSLIVIAAVALFVVIVFRTAQSPTVVTCAPARPPHFKPVPWHSQSQRFAPAAHLNSEEPCPNH